MEINMNSSDDDFDMQPSCVDSLIAEETEASEGTYNDAFGGNFGHDELSLLQFPTEPPPDSHNGGSYVQPQHIYDDSFETDPTHDETAPTHIPDAASQNPEVSSAPSETPAEIPRRFRSSSARTGVTSSLDQSSFFHNLRGHGNAGRNNSVARVEERISRRPEDISGHPRFRESEAFRYYSHRYGNERVASALFIRDERERMPYCQSAVNQDWSDAPAPFWNRMPGDIDEHEGPDDLTAFADIIADYERAHGGDANTAAVAEPETTEQEPVQSQPQPPSSSVESVQQQLNADFTRYTSQIDMSQFHMAQLPVVLDNNSNQFMMVMDESGNFQLQPNPSLQYIDGDRVTELNSMEGASAPPVIAETQQTNAANNVAAEHQVSTSQQQQQQHQDPEQQQLQQTASSSQPASTSQPASSSQPAAQNQRRQSSAPRSKAKKQSGKGPSEFEHGLNEFQVDLNPPKSTAAPVGHAAKKRRTSNPHEPDQAQFQAPAQAQAYTGTIPMPIPMPPSTLGNPQATGPTPFAFGNSTHVASVNSMFPNQTHVPSSHTALNTGPDFIPAVDSVVSDDGFNLQDIFGDIRTNDSAFDLELQSKRVEEGNKQAKAGSSQAQELWKLPLPTARENLSNDVPMPDSVYEEAVREATAAEPASDFETRAARSSRSCGDDLAFTKEGPLKSAPLKSPEELRKMFAMCRPMSKPTSALTRSVPSTAASSNNSIINDLVSERSLYGKDITVTASRSSWTDKAEISKFRAFKSHNTETPLHMMRFSSHGEQKHDRGYKMPLVTTMIQNAAVMKEFTRTFNTTKTFTDTMRTFFAMGPSKNPLIYAATMGHYPDWAETPSVVPRIEALKVYDETGKFYDADAVPDDQTTDEKPMNLVCCYPNCAFFKAKFKSKEKSKLHFQQHHADSEACAYCGAVLSRVDALKRHIMRLHSNMKDRADLSKYIHDHMTHAMETGRSVEVEQIETKARVLLEWAASPKKRKKNIRSQKRFERRRRVRPRRACANIWSFASRISRLRAEVAEADVIQEHENLRYIDVENDDARPWHGFQIKEERINEAFNLYSEISTKRSTLQDIIESDCFVY